MEERAINTGEENLGAVRSGWMMDRLVKYVSAMDQTCNDRMGWIV